MSYDAIAMVMFVGMMGMLLTGQRVFGAIGFVAAVSALLLWGDGGSELAFSAAMKLMKWYPLMTLPMFIYMGYIMSESRIADDLYEMFHVWMGPVHGGLAIGTIGLMVVISAMNGLSVAGMAIGATIALPELLRRGYDKVMVTGVSPGRQFARHPCSAQCRSGALRHDRPPAGRPVVAGRCFPRPHDGRPVHPLHRHPLPSAAESGPPLPKEERDISWSKKFALLRAGHPAADDLRVDDGPVPHGRSPAWSKAPPWARPRPRWRRCSRAA